MFKTTTRSFREGFFGTKALACHLSPGSDADTCLNVSCFLFICRIQERQQSTATANEISRYYYFPDENEFSGKLLPCDQLLQCRVLQRELANTQIATCVWTKYQRSFDPTISLARQPAKSEEHWSFTCIILQPLRSEGLLSSKSH